MSGRAFLIMTLLLAALMAGLPGCRVDWHLMYTPHLDEDFRLPPGELSRKFFDIDRYSSISCPLFSLYKMPPLEELTYGNCFGMPEETSLSWWNLCPLFMLPLPLFPVKEMMWERGNYRFHVKVAYPIYYCFQPHLWYWDVEEIWSDYPVIEVIAAEDE